jgi:PAS domain S-box-containing protein
LDGPAVAPAVDVVALVTSAGGLDALSAVLRELPEDFPAAVIVAQHLSGQGSRLVEILSRRVRLPVRWASEGARIEAGHVSVCPPRSVLEVLPDGSCAIRPSVGSLEERPLDVLLASVGDSYGDRGLGVVLTGMGSDSAAGTAALRAAGGIMIAQDEETAEQPSMPRAAAEAGADLLLPLYEIGHVVADVVRGERLPRSPTEIEAAAELFAGPGEVRRLLREMDWAATPLGPVKRWPEALRLTVRTTLDSAYPMAIWWGSELIQIYNDPWRNFLGATKHPAALGGRAQETWPEIWDAIEPMIEAVWRGEAVGDEDWTNLFWRDGLLEEMCITFSYSPIRDAAGAVVGVLNTAWETTQKVVAERRLQTLQTLAAKLPDAITPLQACELAARALATDPTDVPFALLYLLDRDGLQATLGAAAGLEPGSFAAPHLIRLRDPAALWPLARVLDSSRSGSNGPDPSKTDGVLLRDLQTRVRGLAPPAGAPEGSLPPRCAYLVPLRVTSDDSPQAVLVLGLSPHRPLDEAHRDFLDLVAGQIGAGLAQAQARQRERERLERLAELDRAKTEFFSNVSHEFRTPLTLMLGPLEDVLDHGALPPEVKDELELVRRNASQLLRLVGTMLDFSQIEAGRLRAHFVAVDLAERTREIVALFESAAARSGLELRLDLQDPPERVCVDVEMWEKIVSNLVSNALKFTFQGEIAVTLRALPKHAEMVVRDTGVGIPEEELPHIFRRFHRVRDTRARTYEGAGIGLALVHELVRRHHGRIRAASTVGKGTAFTVWIPFGRRTAVPEAPATEPPRTTTVAAAMAEEALRWAQTTEPPSRAHDAVAPGQSLRNYAPGARILVADDSKDMREYLSRLLASHWAVETASDGAQALVLARRVVPDLVVADVMMPGLDGFALLRELRHDVALSSTPVVLVTARAGEEAAIEGLLAGAADYIVKPFSARELVARVGGQLELARARRHAAELNGFRIGLSDALRALADPLEIQRTACRMLVEQLGADRARFVEVDEAGGELITMGGYAVDGMPGGFGRYALDDYAPLARAILAGRRLAIDDTQSDPCVGEIRPALADLPIGAQIVLPLVRGEGSTVALAVHQRTPRRWTDEDLAIAEEAAGRAWAEVERTRAEQALRASEERMRLAIGTTGMVTWEWLPAADRITTSDSFAAVYGLPSLSAAEDGFALVLPDDRERHREKVRRIATKGGSYNSEFRIRRPDDGRIAWLEERAEAQVDQQGAVERVVGVTLDISERKRSEIALRDNEARLAGLSEAFQSAVKGATLDESLGVLVRTCVEQQGSDARAAFYLADHDRLELRHIVGMPETYAECIDGFRIGADSLACGLATWTGRPVITPDINEAPEWEPWRWLAAEHAYRGVWSFPIETTEGKVVGTLALYLASPRAATARDLELADVITRAAAIIISRAQEAEQRQRAEEHSRETEARLADQERLRSMVNMPGVGMLTWEPATGTLSDANDAFLEMSGYTRQQVSSGQITWRGLTPDEHVAESERQMERLARTGRLGPYEKDLIHADGSRSRMLYAGAGMSDRTAVEYCIDLGPRARSNPSA